MKVLLPLSPVPKQDSKDTELKHKPCVLLLNPEYKFRENHVQCSKEAVQTNLLISTVDLEWSIHLLKDIKCKRTEW